MATPNQIAHIKRFAAANPDEWRARYGDDGGTIEEEVELYFRCYQDKEDLYLHVCQDLNINPINA